MHYKREFKADNLVFILNNALQLRERKALNHTI